MSTGAGLARYAREQTPSGVWIEYSEYFSEVGLEVAEIIALDLDNPDSPPHIIWPTIQSHHEGTDMAGSTEYNDEEVSHDVESLGCIAADSFENQDENISCYEDEDIMDYQEGAQMLEPSDWEVRTEEDSVSVQERYERVQGSTPKTLDISGQVTEDSVGQSTDLYYNPQAGQVYSTYPQCHIFDVK